MLWDQTKDLPKDRFKVVENIYAESGCPIEVRLHLANFVESNFMTNGEVDERTAIDLAQQLMIELDAKVRVLNDPDRALDKRKLQELLDNLRQMYSSNLVKLYYIVRNCLEQEQTIVSQYVGATASGFSSSGPASASSVAGGESVDMQIKQQIKFLQSQHTETSMELDRCKQEQEAFSVTYHNFIENEAKQSQMAKQLGDKNPDVVQNRKELDKMKQAISEKYNMLNNQRMDLTTAYERIFASYTKVQNVVLERELIQWKREQQLAGNGFNNNVAHLEVIQEWCEGLAQIVWNLKQQVKQLGNLFEKINSNAGQSSDKLKHLIEMITESLTNLVTGTFIIEKQPPQVMKTNTRFTATVRLLVGGVLNVHMAAPAVSVSIVSENQANQLLVSNSSTPKRKEEYNSGDILNGTGTMEYHNATKQVSVSFRNLQLKKIKRTEKKGTESVMDEKFSVLFWTEFTVGDLKFQLWTLSLPVVVIVHGNQEPQALATVTWDNAFAEWGRRPFAVPDKVTWGQVSNALNMKWTAACGSNLTDENLYYLACKAFRNNNLPQNLDEINQLVLTWPLFCKDALPDRNFTFWEWFYRILILTQTHMQKLWMEGFVKGFITKQAAETLLVNKPSGTFLLRFSDSELGGVTIAYVRKPDLYQNPSVFMVAPFTTRNLSQRSMADVIFDIADLTVLYPDIPKESFRKFCSSNTAQGAPTNNGYVRHTLVTHVEGVPKHEHMSNPATPHSMYGVGQSMDPQQDHQMQMNFGEDGMDFSDPNIDIMQNIDVSKFMEDYLNSSSGNPPGSF